MRKEGNDDDVNMAKLLHDFTSSVQEWNTTQRPNRYSNTWNVALLYQQEIAVLQRLNRF